MSTMHLEDQGRGPAVLLLGGSPASSSAQWPSDPAVNLAIANRDDPITELIAKAIVNVVATGERDPNLIEERAINALGVRRTDAA